MRIYVFFSHISGHQINLDQRSKPRSFQGQGHSPARSRWYSFPSCLRGMCRGWRSCPHHTGGHDASFPAQPCRMYCLCARFGRSKIQEYQYNINHQISNISHTKFQTLNVSPLVLQLFLPSPLRCSWNSADRRCHDYISVINNFIAY